MDRSDWHCLGLILLGFGGSEISNYLIGTPPSFLMGVLMLFSGVIAVVMTEEKRR